MPPCRTSEKYNGYHLDKRRFPRVKMMFVCPDCPVSFWLRLKNHADPDKACYVVSKFSEETRHVHEKVAIQWFWAIFGLFLLFE